MQAVALVAVIVVVRHILAGNFALKMLVEETEFIADHHAAFGDDLWRERVIVIGCDIEVIRHRNIKTACRTHAEHRREETGLAFSRQGKCKPGRTQNRHATEFKYGARAGARLLVFIERHFVHFHPPGRIVALATREQYVLEFGHVGRSKTHTARFASQSARFVFVVDVFGSAGAVIKLIRCLRRVELNTRARDLGVAFDLHFTGLLRVDDSFAFDDGTGATQFSVARQRNFCLGRAFNRVGVADSRRVVGFRAGIGQSTRPLIQVGGLRIVLRNRSRGGCVGVGLRRCAHVGAGYVEPLRFRRAGMRDLRTKRGRHGGDQREQLRL